MFPTNIVGTIFIWIIVILFATDGYSWKHNRVVVSLFICLGLFAAIFNLINPKTPDFGRITPLAWAYMLCMVSMALSHHLHIRLLLIQFRNGESLYDARRNLNVYLPKLNYQLIGDIWQLKLFRMNNWLLLIFGLLLVFFWVLERLEATGRI